MNIDLNRVSKETWIRTIALVLAIINKALAWYGKSPLPFDSDEIVQLVSDCILFVTAIIAWWKDNAFTVIAQKHNENMKAEKKKAKTK